MTRCISIETLATGDIIIDVMGQITIEIPQRMKKSYRIDSVDSARDVIKRLEQVTKNEKFVDLSSVFGIWAARPESRDEIARELRKKSNSRTKDG